MKLGLSKWLQHRSTKSYDMNLHGIISNRPTDDISHEAEGELIAPYTALEKPTWCIQSNLVSRERLG